MILAYQIHGPAVEYPFCTALVAAHRRYYCRPAPAGKSPKLEHLHARRSENSPGTRETTGICLHFPIPTSAFSFGAESEGDGEVSGWNWNGCLLDFTDQVVHRLDALDRRVRAAPTPVSVKCHHHLHSGICGFYLPLLAVTLNEQRRRLRGVKGGLLSDLCATPSASPDRPNTLGSGGRQRLDDQISGHLELPEFIKSLSHIAHRGADATGASALNVSTLHRRPDARDTR